jgi:phosphoglucomutase
MEPGYLENFIQAILDVVSQDADVSKHTLVVGGDGRYFNREAIQTIVHMAAANGMGRVMAAHNGILSTPAASAVIRARNAIGGIVLSASHNPGGIDADFGVKYNGANGGPAPEDITDRIYQRTLTLNEYKILDAPPIDLAKIGTSRIGQMEVDVFDSLTDYTALMERLFAFDRLRAFLATDFRMCFDAMNGVTGPFARRIFTDLLGAPAATVMRGTPLEDFGGEHPDPNLTYAADLVARLNASDAPDFGAACDGDGDRNLILGRCCFVSPGDSLAVIAEHAATAIPGYRDGLSGIARSMPTSTAADRVAEAMGIPCFETPTGWKFFGSLLDAGRITLCGEESFGTGSNHVREKDGLWAVLAWLSILEHTRKPVDQILREHWQRFGRSYYQRHDYEGVPADAANKMIADLRTAMARLPGASFASSRIKTADDFAYTDPVNGSVTANQGIRLLLEDGSRVILRLSGTGTEGATLRVYFEAYSKDDIAQDPAARIAPLADALDGLTNLRAALGRNAPDVIT